MGKRLLKVATCLLLSLCCLAGTIACKKKSDKQKPVVCVPELPNLVVELSEKPTAFFIGDYTLEKVEIDGVELSQEAYKIQDGYCIFQKEYYADFGIGEHIVKMYFSEGTYEFTISVKDSDVYGDDIYQTECEQDYDVYGYDVYDYLTI